jgi:hypothetical protein
MCSSFTAEQEFYKTLGRWMQNCRLTSSTLIPSHKDSWTPHVLLKTPVHLQRNIQVLFVVILAVPQATSTSWTSPHSFNLPVRPVYGPPLQLRLFCTARLHLSISNTIFAWTFHFNHYLTFPSHLTALIYALLTFVTITRIQFWDPDLLFLLTLWGSCRALVVICT